MLNRRLDVLDTGLGRGLIEGVISAAAHTLALGTQEEIQAEIDRFAGFVAYELEEFKEGTLKSSHLNDQFEKILVSLHALYKHLNLAYQTQKNHSTLAFSDRAILEQGVLRLLEDVKVYKLLKLNPDWNDVRLISFRDGRNLSTSRLKAEVDARSRELTQKVIRKRRLNSRSGNFKPSVEVTILSDGVTGTTRRDHLPENAVDPDPLSFWAEVLFSDRPVETTYQSTTYQGFIAQLAVDFKQLELVNTVEMLPFGLYPIRILNLETSSDGTTYTQVPIFEEPTASLSWFSLRFDPIPTRYIRVTLLQESYRAQTYNVPRSSLVNNQLLNSVADEELRLLLGGREDSDFEARLADFDSGTRRLLDQLAKLDDKVSELVAPRSGLAVQERLSLELRPLVPGTDKLTVGLTQEAPESDEILQFSKAEYILGLMHLEASFTEYAPISEYVSPTYTTDGTLFEIAVETDEVHTLLSVPNTANELPATVAEYEVEIAPNRSKPLVPYKPSLVISGATSIAIGASYAVYGGTNPAFPTTEIHEIVPIDPSNRTGYVRFSTGTSAPRVYRNGQLLTSTAYTFTAASKKLVVAQDAWMAGATFVVRYAPSSGQDVIDVRDVFDSFPLRTPEQFDGTDANGRIRLTAAPFINYDIIYNTSLFYKPSQEAKYFYRRGADQTLIDGRIYGTAETSVQGDADNPPTNGISTTTVTITANTGTGNPNLEDIGFYSPGAGDPPGILRIGTELLTYTGLSFTTFTGCTRGAFGTTASAYAPGVTITATGEMFYEPVKVFVDGVRARNLTDYDKGEHPAFTPERTNTRVHSYIQAGPNVYFSGPINGRIIDVQYDILAQYLKLKAKLKSCVPGLYGHTAEISEIRLLLNSAEI